MTTFVQADRPLAVDTPLGPDKLVLTSFTGQEEMSRLFSFQLEMLSEEEGLDPTQIVGKDVTFYVKFPDETERYFNGIVNHFVYAGYGDRAHIYRAQVVPWLWFLTRTTDCRIFQNKTAPEIIEQIFGDLGFSDYELNASGTHPQREYCVQYRESDFDFVSRLMEEEGMFYFFRHEDGKHTLVIGDDNGTFEDATDNEVQFLSNLSQPELTDQIRSWEHQYQYVSGKWAHTDYDFENPSTDLMATTNGLVELPQNSNYEFYDYPGEYVPKSDGEALLQLRMEEEEVGYDTVRGVSECRSFSPGGKFTLTKHHAESEAGKGYILTTVHHSAHLGGSYIPGASPVQDIYKNTFVCIPDSVKFRPARITDKPKVEGIETAVVVGASGDEIHTDQYGRVKCQFHWDREGQDDDQSSCFIRVATPWSGKDWGMIHIPRVGQEVVVGFLGGDPDRPLITGMVYNADTMPPWGLPDNKTQSGIKTRSTPEGGDDNFNELRFEDKKDEEEIYLHAERDFNCVIENDETRRVGFDKSDPGDQTIEVYNDQNLTVGVGSGGGSQTVEIQQDRTVTINAGNDTLEISQGNREVTISMGNETTSISLGKSEKEAMQSIELKVGQSSIKLDQSGVTIKGLMVKIEGMAMSEMKAPMTTVKADALLTVKGGITMIN